MAFQVLSGLYRFSMATINEIEVLAKLISKLPGLGPRSSRRIILKLINNRDELMKPMVNALADLFKNISIIVPDGETIESCGHNTRGKNKISVDEVLSKSLELIN